ncbi:MAG TPA: histidine phosphatase family protein [Burkholderiaceae bacterium]|jgi:probable phosphoglycerate mutase|nr:histidine phosphatase family protein [Burkholderiaceae bacterium]
MLEILLIRHGETDWNAERRLQGHLDIELNNEGARQATLLAAALQGEHIDAIYASDLRRARQTAQAFATNRNMTVQIEQDLRERCYGAFEGLRYVEIAERFPQAYESMLARELDVRYPPGVNVAETLREFSARAVGALMHLLKKHPEHKKIAVVTHGGVLDCLNRAARGLDLSLARDFDIPNAAINRFWWNGSKLQMAQWGDVAHLTSLALDEVDR